MDGMRRAASDARRALERCGACVGRLVRRGRCHARIVTRQHADAELERWRSGGQRSTAARRAERRRQRRLRPRGASSSSAHHGRSSSRGCSQAAQLTSSSSLQRCTSTALRESRCRARRHAAHRSAAPSQRRRCAREALIERGGSLPRHRPRQVPNWPPRDTAPALRRRHAGQARARRSRLWRRASTMRRLDGVSRG